MHWKTNRIIRLVAWMAALLTLVFASPAIAQGKFAPRQISQGQRCPVCHMSPAHYPQWRAEIIFKDNHMAAFDSPVDLFRFYRHMRKYDPQHTVADIGAIYVTDYQQGGWVDAKHAFFVKGSRVRGPMGGDLPAFAHKMAAQRFITQSGGQLLLFDEVTSAMLRGLHGGSGSGRQGMPRKPMNPCGVATGMSPMGHAEMNR